MGSLADWNVCATFIAGGSRLCAVKMTALLSAKHCLSLYHPTEGVTFLSQRHGGAEDILECVRQAVFRATPLFRNKEKRCRARLPTLLVTALQRDLASIFCFRVVPSIPWAKKINSIIPQGIRWTIGYRVIYTDDIVFISGDEHKRNM
jgi:hypothetical protein